ncbi:MAG: hypothetical protein ACF8XB_13845 [Planctomycetota bacterium JB042]
MKTPARAALALLSLALFAASADAQAVFRSSSTVRSSSFGASFGGGSAGSGFGFSFGSSARSSRTSVFGTTSVGGVRVGTPRPVVVSPIVIPRPAATGPGTCRSAPKGAFAGAGSASRAPKTVGKTVTKTVVKPNGRVITKTVVQPKRKASGGRRR